MHKQPNARARSQALFQRLGVELKQEVTFGG
jgi:hypothetical protein